MSDMRLSCRDVTNKAGIQVEFVLVTSRQAKEALAKSVEPLAKRTVWNCNLSFSPSFSLGSRKNLISEPFQRFTWGS